MNLVRYNDPVLYQPTQAFDMDNPPMDPEELFHSLRAMMMRSGGVGLSANQVGIPYQVFVLGDPKSENSITAIFNPKIVYQSDDTDVQDEGCLSFPGLVMSVSRAKEIRVRCTSYKGVVDSIKFTGLTARVFQHECAHLAGKPFFHGASRLKIERAVKTCKKNTGFTYPVGELYKLASMT